MNWTPHLVLLAAITLCILGLAVYRRRVARGEDDTLHVLEGDQRYIPEQVKLASRLDVLDKWGKILTVVAVLYALILAAIYGYSLFSSNEIRMG
jgi:hypothetical protein